MAEAAAAVEVAYRRYITDYPAALWGHFQSGATIDYAALDCWSFPLLFITGSPAVTHVAITDLAGFDAQVRALYAGYVADGWAGGIAVDRVDVTMVTQTVAIVDTAGTRYHADGSVLNRWVACYCMRRTGETWRHFAIFDTAPPRPDLAAWASWLAAVDPR